jgi:hypothetical protein
MRHSPPDPNYKNPAYPSPLPSSQEPSPKVEVCGGAVGVWKYKEPRPRPTGKYKGALLAVWNEEGRAIAPREIF